jgi:hypothetical protein
MLTSSMAYLRHVSALLPIKYVMLTCNDTLLYRSILQRYPRLLFQCKRLHYENALLKHDSLKHDSVKYVSAYILLQ